MGCRTLAYVGVMQPAGVVLVVGGGQEGGKMKFHSILE